MKILSCRRPALFSLVAALVTVLIVLLLPPRFKTAALPGAQTLATVSSAQGDSVNQAHRQQIVPAAYGQLPLTFIANSGQLDGQVRYYQQSGRQSTYFTPTGIYMDLYRNVSRTAAHPADLTKSGTADTAQIVQGQALKLSPLHMNRQVRIAAAEQQPGKVNYFRGSDPRKWQTGIPTYGKVIYENAYPGIDLKFYGNQRQMEYDVVVSRGADPRQARFEYSGIEGLALGKAGELQITLPDGQTIQQKKPVIYQDINGRRVSVNGSYKLYGKRGYGFEVASYDRAHSLVIDPVLSYSTYLGGADFDSGFAIAVDAAGSAYVTGVTLSEDFPVTAGAFDTRSGFAFVTKLNAAGTALVYSTYLDGGTKNQNAPTGIAVDNAGNVYVAGTTTSKTFPTTPGAFDRVCDTVSSNFCADAFVTKLNATGNALIYSTYLGGNRQDQGAGIAVDSAGNAYVTGTTNSTDFPTTAGAFSATLPGSQYKNFVTKLNAAGSGLSYSTYLGYFVTYPGLAVDASGNAYIATTSLPGLGISATPGAFDTTQDAGSEDGLVAKLNPTGSALVYATYLGGNSGDEPTDIAVDRFGNAYVTGGTFSSNFPTTPGAYQAPRNSTGNGFLSKLNPTGNALVYSSILGELFTANRRLGVDSMGNATVANYATTPDQPTPNGFDSSYNGGIDIFIQQLNFSGSALVYASYLGGNSEEKIRDIAVDPNGSVYLTGSTFSANFPTTEGAFDRTLVVREENLPEYLLDGFVAKISTSLVQFAAAAYSVSEAGSSVSITVTRAGNITSAVSVDYATSNGTALAASDYTARSGTFTWAAGDATPRTFTVPITNDSNVEGDETVNLTLSNITGAMLSAINPVVLTILDDDSIVQFNSAFFSVSESASSAIINVTRSGRLGGAATVNFSTSDGSAAAGSDYSETHGSLNFAPNEASKSFSVPISDDALAESGETVNLSLSAAAGGGQIGPQGTATLVIRDNEATQVSFRNLAYAGEEGQPGASITVLRQGDVSAAVSVRYATSDNTALSGPDYSSASGTLNFAPRQAIATFSVSVSDDALAEYTERVNLTLSNPVGATLGAMPTALLVIRDNEPAQVSFRNLNYSVGEGTPAALISVYRLGNLRNPASVNYATANNTALAGLDYTASSGSLSFAAGETLKSFTVPITDDALPEFNERVNLTLSNASGAVLTSPASATLVITSNE